MAGPAALAQLVELSLSTPDTRSSNPVIVNNSLNNDATYIRDNAISKERR